MTDTIIHALIGILRDARLDAREKFPHSDFNPETDTIVTVGARSTRALSPGFGEYLGIETDPRTLAERELYAFRLELELCLDIFSHSNDTATDALAKIERALGHAPAGLRLIRLSAGETKVDRSTEMLKCAVTLKCGAYLTAYADLEADGEFLDFVLKGVLTHGQ